MTPVYALYCQELPERTEGLRAHLAERGVKAEMFRGFHGNTWGIRTTIPYDGQQCISPGHVALNMGTWALWNHIHMSGDVNSHPDDAVITLEDDAVLPPLFNSQVVDLQIKLNYDMPDWDLVFLGLAECEPHVWNKVTERIGRPDSQLCLIDQPFGTHAMMIRRRALPILLDNMAIAQRNLDQQLWERVLAKGLLRWCAVLPTMVRQRTFDYRGTGKVEWAPSCIDPLHTQEAEALAVREQDIKRAAGFLGPERPSQEMITAANLIIDPYPCIYRGEPLEEFGINERGRGIPLTQCARLNVPCHSRRSSTIKLDGELVTACETCNLRVEMPAGPGRARLPLPEGHFNPSIIRWKNKTIMATRDSWGHSKVGLWELTNSKSDWTGEWTPTPISSIASNHPAAPRLEDPRLFIRPHPDRDGDCLCAMFNLPDGYPPKVVQVGYVRFADDLKSIEETVVYQSPTRNKYEKNWAPFWANGELNWVYHTKPEHIVIANGNAHSHITPNPLPWTGGAVRGGAAPVRVHDIDFGDVVGPDPVFYHFFHGCLKRIQGSVYTVGCAVFEAKPPYRVLRQTARPLVWPDLPAADEDVVKRYVVWPGGAIPHAGAWHIALGIDDTFCRIVRIPYEEVESALSDVHESASVTSIRDTAIVKGIKNE